MSADAPLDDASRARLLAIARDSIEHGLREGTPLVVETDALPDALRAVRATFTTLRRDGALRGCVGSLDASKPLAADVADSAFRAAFRDPRFPPLRASELAGLALHVAVLGPLERIDVDSRDALLAALRPGRDGLVIEDGPHRGTFLPAVWDTLPRPADFLGALEEKAGLAVGHWSPSLRAWRYEVASVD